MRLMMLWHILIDRKVSAGLEIGPRRDGQAVGDGALLELRICTWMDCHPLPIVKEQISAVAKSNLKSVFQR